MPIISGMNDSDSMRAVVTDGEGGPEVLTVKSVPKPVPGTGEIRVRVATSGINRADLLQPWLRLGFRQLCLEVGTQLGDDRLEFQRMPRGRCR